MSGDKRSVATDALEVLGKIIPETMEVGRDAVHLASITCTSDQVLMPGQDVGIKDGKAVISAKPVGIVDPFLSKTWIAPGQKFLVLIYPRKIASLRHVWSHPDIPDEVQATPVVEKTVVKYVTRSGSQYDESEALKELMKIARDKWDVDVDVLFDAMDEGYMSDGGRFEGEGGAVHIPTEAWDLFEVVHGRRARRENGDDIYFSCSC